MALMLLCSEAVVAAPDTGKSSIQRIEKMIGIARAGGDDGAHELATMMSTIDPLRVDDATLAELAALLDSPNDRVRFWVAAALGNLGPRAKVHAPKLQKLATAGHCRIGTGIHSGDIAESALTKMGIVPFPTTCPPALGRQY